MMRLICADFLLTLGPGTTGPLYVFYFHDAKGFTIQDVSVLLIFYASAGILGALFWGGPMAQRFGKHRAVQIACVAYCDHPVHPDGRAAHAWQIRLRGLRCRPRRRWSRSASAPRRS